MNDINRNDHKIVELTLGRTVGDESPTLRSKNTAFDHYGD